MFIGCWGDDTVMGTIKRLKHRIDQVHTHHVENGVPLQSAIQWQADNSRFTAEEIRQEYERFYDSNSVADTNC